MCKNPQAAGGECCQARAAVLPAFTLLLSKEQRSLNATQVIAMEKDQGSQKTHQFNPQKGSSSKVNFLKSLMPLNSGVCVQLSKSYIVDSIFKVSHIISLIVWKLLLHPPFLHYLVPHVLKSLKSRESNMNFVLREYMKHSLTLSWKKLSCQPVSLFKEKKVSRTVLTMSHKGWFNINSLHYQRMSQSTQGVQQNLLVYLSNKIFVQVVWQPYHFSIKEPLSPERPVIKLS